MVFLTVFVGVLVFSMWGLLATVPAYAMVLWIDDKNKPTWCYALPFIYFAFMFAVMAQVVAWL